MGEAEEKKNEAKYKKAKSDFTKAHGVRSKLLAGGYAAFRS